VHGITPNLPGLPVGVWASRRGDHVVVSNWSLAPQRIDLTGQGWRDLRSGAAVGALELPRHGAVVLTR
jgi:hypothetical protein